MTLPTYIAWNAHIIYKSGTFYVYACIWDRIQAIYQIPDLPTTKTFNIQDILD